VESLASCVAYSFTPVGAGILDPIAVQLESGMPLDLGLVNLASALADDFGTVATGFVAGAIDLGTA
jgi:hypothetical protein